MIGSGRDVRNIGGVMAIQLNPLYAPNNRQLYDVEMGYERVHQDARRRFRRAGKMDFGDLNSRRVEKFRLFTAKEAAKIRKRMDEGINPVADRSETLALLKKVFMPPLDARLIAFFNSEYVPHAMSYDKIMPNEPFTHSDCWHCDGGPTNHLVMMIYLSGSRKKTANTLFTTGRMTDYLKVAGYVFCHMEQRLADVSPIVNRFQLGQFEEIAFEIKAGEAIVFQSVNILHKRALPTQGPRYTITLALLPSPMPWLKACEKTGKPLRLGMRPTFENIPESELP